MNAAIINSLPAEYIVPLDYLKLLVQININRLDKEYKHLDARENPLVYKVILVKTVEQSNKDRESRDLKPIYQIKEEVIKNLDEQIKMHIEELEEVYGKSHELVADAKYLMACC